MNKTIHINPELFKLSGTRKRTTTPKNISIKSPLESNNKTLSKRNALLKFIRKHQDSNNIQNDDNSHVQEIDNDFEKSLQYLMEITDTTKMDNNHLMKNDTSHEQVNMNFPEQQNIQPHYGCLKNGSLPTYRQFYCKNTLKNRTGMGRSRNEIVSDDYLDKEVFNEKYDNIPEVQQPLTDNIVHKTTNKCIENENIDRGMTQQRKILKRTFRIGKSNTERKISVLVSNKTLRHNSSNKSITLKKTPLNDVRKYLVKRGFVKIGTAAPPDVLRKMYESASMVCGDIKNHNPDTLMHNFINSEKKSW